ncbi:MAG: MSMEG_0570 family nitrogen starvation response protein [Methylobacter sp.]
MPEMRFRVRWPDQSESVCYSPSQIIKDFFEAGRDYPLYEFIERSREALSIASERVRQKYGYACSSAMDQLTKIEIQAIRFGDDDNPRVLVVEFIE